MSDFVSGMEADTDLRKILSTRRPKRQSGRGGEVLKKFDAQLGEIGWHSITYDDSLDTVSDSHAAVIVALARAHGIQRPRILEMGAYAHHSAQKAAHELGGEAVSHDISPVSLSVGREGAVRRGMAPGTQVAGDFHSLPFADGAFDIVFIASAIHHTWRPDVVLKEMVRVCRPGGIIRVENEPVGRLACLYNFRGNRTESRTDFENAIEEVNLTGMISSPFPGSRAELLFNMIENDKIPLEIYEDTLLEAGRAVEWKLDPVIGSFEQWLLDTKPDAAEIVERIEEDLQKIVHRFTVKDEAAGFSIPTADQIWPVAYRVARALKGNLDKRELARLFGAALAATIITKGKGGTGDFLRRELTENDHALIDDFASAKFSINFVNTLPEPQNSDFGKDWSVVQEAGGHYSLVNLGSNCELKFDFDRPGVLVIRTYSVPQDEPYFYSITVDGDLVYTHCVAAAESHMAKVFIDEGAQVFVHHHDAFGNPVAVGMHSRVIPKFIPVF